MRSALRSMPARLANLSFWPLKPGAGHRAATLLSQQDLLESDLDLSSDELERTFRNTESELNMLYVRAGFETEAGQDRYAAFSQSLGDQVARVLRGPARERIVSRAARLTSWPVTFLMDVPPIAFFGIGAYNAVASYFHGQVWTGAYFLHSATVFGILLVSELAIYSFLARLMAWSARKASVKDLRNSVTGHRIAFLDERRSLDEAKAILEEVRSLKDSISEA